MSLQKYVADKNHFNAIFKQPAVSLDTFAGRQKVADMLDSDLSPENLTCDGERPRTRIPPFHCRSIPSTETPKTPGAASLEHPSDCSCPTVRHKYRTDRK